MQRCFTDPHHHGALEGTWRFCSISSRWRPSSGKRREARARTKRDPNLLLRAVRHTASELKRDPNLLPRAQRHFRFAPSLPLPAVAARFPGRTLASPSTRQARGQVPAARFPGWTLASPSMRHGFPLEARTARASSLLKLFLAVWGKPPQMALQTAQVTQPVQVVQGVRKVQVEIPLWSAL